MITARRPSANSSPATSAPASSVKPFGVIHHGLRCIATNSAPLRSWRKAMSRLRYDRSSPASPMTTAATGSDRASASSRPTRSWPAHSRRASGAASTRIGLPAWWLAVYAAAADAAVMISAASTSSPVALPNAAASDDRWADEKFVRTRYGMPRRRSSTSASGEPAIGLLRNMSTPSASRMNARTPSRAARKVGRRRSGAWPDGRLGAAISAREDRMGLLDGKKALIFGVANDHSIAWGIAKALHDEGATLGFSSVESLLERRVRPLAESIGATFVEAM